MKITEPFGPRGDPKSDDRVLSRPFELSPLADRLAKGALWSFAGATVSRVSILASAILVARVLHNEEYGALGIIQTTAGMLAAFAGTGMGQMATKFVSQLRDDDPSRAGRIIALSELVALGAGAIFSLLLVVSGQWLASTMLAAPHLAKLLCLASLLSFFGSINAAQTGALAGFEAFKTIAKINLIVAVVSFPLIVIGVHLGGLAGVIGGLICSMVTNSALNHLALRSKAREAGTRLNFAECGKEWRVLFSFGLPSILATVMVGPVTWICSAILVHQSNGYAEMGIFNAANQWRMAILFLPATLSVIVLPALVAMQKDKDLYRFKKVLRYNIVLNGAIALAMAALVALASKTIMRSYGAGFDSGRTVLILLALSAVLTAVTGVVGQAIASSGRMWSGLGLNCVWALTLIFSMWLLRKQGAIGLALSFLIAYGCHMLTVSAFTHLNSIKTYDIKV